MKASTLRKADRIMKDRTPEPRMQIFWWDLDETYDKVQARMRERIASGKASKNDKFVVFTWTRPEDEGAGS
jgi:hypothetical protein